MIGERLAIIRRKNGYTQARLAAKLGVSLPTVRAWEQGKSSPKYDTLVQLCKLYDVTSDFILGLKKTDPNYQDLEFIPSRPSLEEYEEYLKWKRSRNKEKAQESSEE